MKKVYILPTGDEIKNGTVLDLDAPELMAQTLRVYPQAEITRLCPLVDVEDTILEAVKALAGEQPDLIVLIGGSGGGHRFSSSLGKDFTHSALERFLDLYSSHEIYGKNGHLWSKLICGRKNRTTLINVPGPLVEAAAAYAAFLRVYGTGRSLDEISLAMAEAVYDQYPAGGVKPARAENQ